MGRPPKTNLPQDLSHLLEQIGRNIRFLREQKGFTQVRLAKLSKISITTLNEIETKQFRDIKLSTLCAIARTLSVSPAVILQRSDVEMTNREQQQLLKASEAILKITQRIRPSK